LIFYKGFESVRYGSRYERKMEYGKRYEHAQNDFWWNCYLFFKLTFFQLFFLSLHI